MKPLVLLMILFVGVGFGIWYLNEERASTAAQNELLQSYNQDHASRSEWS
ncbi:hypothetical protein [Modicisalibacter luteus]|uniref:LPS export ABC transporter periplasmic protein LptC n=1 Tax=Modicisalibacter luteus TaxID=453962 RepID=A0ABV7M273_9GAMM|nr:hypothetical protein [Halomonas lutea]GHA90720.1 hypothetical protein GCM10007159_10020 [Halomonas lutea]